MEAKGKDHPKEDHKDQDRVRCRVPREKDQETPLLKILAEMDLLGVMSNVTLEIPQMLLISQLVSIAS